MGAMTIIIPPAGKISEERKGRERSLRPRLDRAGRLLVSLRGEVSTLKKVEAFPEAVRILIVWASCPSLVTKLLHNSRQEIQIVYDVFARWLRARA